MILTTRNLLFSRYPLLLRTRDVRSVFPPKNKKQNKEQEEITEGE